MVEWIVYCLSISALLAIAALAAERALGHYRKPVRWAWAGAIAGSLLLPLAAWLVPQVLRDVSGGLPTHAVSLEALAALGIGTGAGEAGASGWIPSLRTVLLGLWAASALAVGGWISHSYWRLRREMRGWTPGRVLGSAVLLSPDRGPAVVGVGRGVIVFPRWISELRDELLRLVFLHEREHQRAGDHRLFAAGLLGVVAMPWNPVVWWQLRRLRLAIEYDCDRRVLGHGVPAREYGEALLAVGRRIGRLPLAAAAFAERRSAVERRLRRLTEPLRALRGPRAALAGLVALGAIALACESPAPVEPNASPIADALPTESEAPVPARQLEDSSQRPSFIPYDKPPSLENRSEIVELLREAYPTDLRADGVTGRVELWLYIDREGRVEKSVVKTSSGVPAFDEAAFEVAAGMRFEPALNRDEPTDVWVSQWITFEASARGNEAASQEADAEPLLVVDGVVQADREAALSDLRPSRIESIEIVKGEAALQLYGEQGRDGVILVTTKEATGSAVRADPLAAEPGEARFRIRGHASGLGDAPLIVVDGVIQGAGISLDDLNAQEIDRVEILKGAAARGRYGERARDGAIVITTRGGEAP